jgi:hypothetical protein
MLNQSFTAEEIIIELRPRVTRHYAPMESQKAFAAARRREGLKIVIET